MKLFDALRYKPEGDKLANRLVDEIRVRTMDKLVHVRDLFPHFTDHSIRHVDGVISVLDWLIPDDVKTALNEWELYFLIAAAYLHDIGMVETCPCTPSGDEWERYVSDWANEHDSDSTLDPSEIRLRAKRDFIRDTHHTRSEQYIRSHWQDLGLRAKDTPAEGQIVGRLALGHRQEDLGDGNQFGEVAFGNNQIIHRDLLAAYLRLADELDTTTLRTPWAEYEVVRHYDELSALEWAKHLSVSGVSAAHGLLTVSGECREHKVFLRLRRLEDDIRRKLMDMKRMLRRPYATADFVLEDPIPYHDIEFSIEHIGYLPVDIRFRLEDREITELIMGDRLYGDRTACIRELLQNAMDTCQEAKEVRPSSWNPEIEAIEDEEGRTIAVSDNGMGMDEHIVRQYFANIGISYYRSPEFQGTFEPVSEFGIGVLSCFMIADRIEVDSKRDSSQGVHLEISGLTEPFVVKPSSRGQPGTTVKLHLKEDVVGTIDLAERIKHFAPHPQFPIKIRPRDRDATVFTDRGLKSTRQDLKNVLHRESRYGQRLDNRRLDAISDAFVITDENHIELEAEGVRIGVTLLDGLEDEYRKRTGFYLHQVSGSRVSQRGFCLPDESERCSQLASNTWLEIDLAGGAGLPLMASRARAVDWPPQIWSALCNLYVEAIGRLWRLYPDQSAGNWWNFVSDHCGLHLWGDVPTGLRTEFNDHAVFCVLTSKGFDSMDLDTVASFEGKIYVWSEMVTRHSEMDVFSSLLPRDILLVMLPYNILQGDASDHWLSKMLGRALDGGVGDLLSDIGVKFRSREFGGQVVAFFDAGDYLGRWYMDIDKFRGFPEYDLLDIGDMCFDWHHPMSQLLLEHCQRDRLSSGMSMLLAGLSHVLTEGSPSSMRETDVQRQLITQMKMDKLIPHDIDIALPAALGADVHECIYIY